MGRHQGAEQAAAAMVAVTFYATIVWAIGYWLFYPAWPLVTGYTKGCSATSQRERRWPRRSAAAKRARRSAATSIAAMSLDRHRKRSRAVALCAWPAARRRSATIARPAMARRRQGGPGYPNLNDDDWLWGGTLDDIHRPSARHPRRRCRDARIAQMPRFGADQHADDGRRSSTSRNMCCRCPATPTTPRRVERGARRSSPRTAPPVMATTARAMRELGAPN